jgi:hypothetical protein
MTNVKTKQQITIEEGRFAELRMTAKTTQRKSRSLDSQRDPSRVAEFGMTT